MIKTKRCLLSPIQESNFNEFKQLNINEKVRKYLGGTVTDEKILKNKFMALLDEVKNKEAKQWIVRITESNEFIGILSLTIHHNGVDTEISYQFLPNYWGNGFAEETVNEIVQYAFNELKIEELLAETQTANEKSCKLLEKIGMTVEEKMIRFEAEQSIYSIKNKK